MGPRFFDRGNLYELPTGVQHMGASMGPRFFDRGNAYPYFRQLYGS